MSGALIGALRATLGLDSAAFEQGANAIIKKSRATERSLTKFGQGMMDLGQSLTLGVTAPLVAFGVTAGKAASDAAELQSAFDQTFGGMAKDMSDWAQTTGDAMGRSTQAIQQAANTFGIFFNQAAPTRKAAADLSKTFAVLAQDLSSFYNVSESDALAKLRSGLAGESEPLRDFGVFLTEASVKAKALEMGLADANGEISEQAKVLARANLILEATKNAQGDVARTAGGTANQARAAKAAFEELQVTVGTKLLPVITPLITKLADVLNAFSRLPPGVQSTAVGLAAIAAAAGPLIFGIGALVKGLAPLLAVMATVSAAGGPLLAMKAGLAGLAAVLGPIAVPLAALAAAGALIYAHWDKIGPALSEAGRAIAAALGPEIRALASELGATLSELWNGPLGEALRAAVAGLVDLYLGFYKALGTPVLQIVKVLLQALTNFFAFIGDGVRMVSRLLQGDFVGAAQAAASAFNRFFGGIPAFVTEQVAKLVTAVRTWMVDKLDDVWNWVTGKIETVKKAFFGLYDAVVGHSYIPDMVNEIGQHIARLAQNMVNPSLKATKTVEDSFATMANNTLDSFKQLVGSIKGGGFLDILSSVINMATQLGSIGLFGSKIAGNINSKKVPAYAGGTSFHPGGMAMVGERGPELVNLPRGSQVFPNGSGPATRVQVVPSAYFDVVVDGRILRASPAIASAGGDVGVARMRSASQWALR